MVKKYMCATYGTQSLDNISLRTKMSYDTVCEPVGTNTHTAASRRTAGRRDLNVARKSCITTKKMYRIPRPRVVFQTLAERIGTG